MEAITGIASLFLDLHEILLELVIFNEKVLKNI